MSAALDLDAMIRESIAQTGCSDFGGDDLLEAFRVLVPSLNAEAALTPAGVAGRHAGMVRALSNRLRLQRYLLQHPQIRDEPIAGPVVIVGLPRSGTTKLHRMIAADPLMQKLLLWKILSPVPAAAPSGAPPPSGALDPRIAVGESFARMLREQQPGVYAAHPMAACEPDEDVFALEITGRVYINCSAVRAPTYRKWLDAQSFDGVYRWLRLFLQVWQFQDGARGRPWVLKAPQHLGFLPDLFRHFPQATIVHCHRSPEVTVASYAAMITSARQSVSNEADAAEVGQYGLSFWSDLTNRYLRDRALYEGAHAFVDLSYRDILGQGLDSVARCYAAAGLELTPQAREAMAAWERDNAQHKHGRHAYSLAAAGLTESAIAREFKAYMARFGPLT